MPLLAALFALQFVAAVHALRRGVRPAVAFAIAVLPGIGALIYFLAVAVPAFAKPEPAGNVSRHGEASAAAHLRTADALLAHGDPWRAAVLYREALDGPWRDDPEVMLKLSRAYLIGDHAAAARETLEALARTAPDFRSEEGQLLYARALEAEGRTADALRVYAALDDRSESAEAKCRYALLLEAQGESGRARALFSETIRTARGGADREWADIAEAHLRKP